MLKKTYRLRLNLLYAIPLIMMPGLVARLGVLQIKDRDVYKREADKQHFGKHDFIPSRGKIYDSNGHELAGSVMLDVAYVEVPKLAQISKEEVLSKLAQRIHDFLPGDDKQTYDYIYGRLTGKGGDKRVFLVRGLTEQDRTGLKKILADFSAEHGVPKDAITFEMEGKRRYSRPSLAPQIVGFTMRDSTGDNLGADGVELFYNKQLRGSAESYRARKNASGNLLEPADPDILENTYGHSVKLTINESIQAVTQNALAQGVESVRADSGVAVCMNVKTGEVLSMASVPTYNLDLRGEAVDEQRRNRSVSDVIEPGSVMKIITFLSLLDDDKVEPTDTINCEGGTWQMKGRTITDSKRLGSATVAEIFQYSSNIGTIKAARALSEESFYNRLKAFGFGDKTGIDLPGEVRGRLRHYKQWTPGFSMSSLPMGYELQVSAIQMCAAVSSIANKGQYMQPHVVKEILDHNDVVIQKIEPKMLRQVAQPVSCRKILNMMELVVTKGTGKTAALEGYRVGGKTGTTKKLVNGTYSKQYIASFCGVAPMEDPEICVYVYVDNPKGDKLFGGPVAAPIFREIAREALKALRVPMRTGDEQPEDFDVTLDAVRKKIEGRVPMELIQTALEDYEPSIGSMPKVLNDSLREAVGTLAGLGLDVEPLGNGPVVIAQSPQPGETIEQGTIVKLTLGTERELLMKLQAEIARDVLTESDEDVDTATVSAEPYGGMSSMTLTLANDGVVVPVSAITAGRPAADTRSRIQPQQSEERFPDVDEFAQKPPSATAGKKAWAKFEKEQKEREKLIREGKLEELAAQDQEVAEAPTDEPQPNFDGSEEIDPTTENVAPVKLSAESVKPAPTPKPPEPGDSLYSLMGRR